MQSGGASPVSISETGKPRRLMVAARCGVLYEGIFAISRTGAPSRTPVRTICITMPEDDRSRTWTI